MKKFIILCALFFSFNYSCEAVESMPISQYEGYEQYSGWISADMSINNGTITKDAAYSMNLFKSFGLVPVVYCSSGGSHMGTYYTFFVNPYNNCLIIGKVGNAFHSDVFSADLQPFELTCEFVYYTDMKPKQDFYRKIIDVAKKEFQNYQQLVK